MKTIFQFRFSFIFFVVLFVLTVSITAFAQQQTPADWIRQYDGIPIIASLPYDWAIPNHNIDVDSMKRAGIDAVILTIANGTKMQVLRDWDNGGFRVIPIKSINSNLDTLNWITYYTDAKYTVWETEDTPEDTSYILHNPNIMDEVTLGNDKFIKLKSSAAGLVNELIRGPYYCQNVYEQNIQGVLDTARYTADFRLKLELRPGYSDNIHPDTPLCIIKVTQSKLAVPNTWILDCTYPVRSIVVTRRNFQLLNQFQNFSFAYNLFCDSCSQTTTTPAQYYPAGYSLNSTDLSDIQKFLLMRDYIEFKVKWLGKPNYLLSIDKITVYDQKGLQLMGEDSSEARALIEDQASTLSAYNSNITGWLGIDEPNSIDKYAPVKKVNEILNNYSNSARPLWLSIMGKWDGVWENSDNPFGTYHLSPWKEMKKRIGNINIWQDIYYLDYPWNSDECTNCTEPWYSENIKIAAEL